VLSSSADTTKTSQVSTNSSSPFFVDEPFSSPTTPESYTGTLTNTVKSPVVEMFDILMTMNEETPLSPNPFVMHNKGDDQASESKLTEAFRNIQSSSTTQKRKATIENLGSWVNEEDDSDFEILEV
jgi:hypothetical protein